jgi:transposase
MQKCTLEFKELAVKRVNARQQIRSVAWNTGLNEQSVCNQVRADKRDTLNPPDGKAVTPEQMELPRRRADNAWRRMENEILKEVTAHFAKDML